MDVAQENISISEGERSLHEDQGKQSEKQRSRRRSEVQLFAQSVTAKASSRVRTKQVSLVQEPLTKTVFMVQIAS